MQKTRKPS